MNEWPQELSGRSISGNFFSAHTFFGNGTGAAGTRSCRLATRSAKPRRRRSCAKRSEWTPNSPCPALTLYGQRQLPLFLARNALLSFFNTERRGASDLGGDDFSWCRLISISSRIFVIFPGERYSESGFQSVIPSCQ
jgi:hypothetical protein